MMCKMVGSGIPSSLDVCILRHSSSSVHRIFHCPISQDPDLLKATALIVHKWLACQAQEGSRHFFPRT